MSDLQVFSPSAKDYEYIGLRFNGRHCGEFNLSVVSSSGLFQQSLFGEFEDKIAEVSGRDGAYYFGTKIKTKTLNLSFAFDNMTSQNKKDIISWLNPRKTSQLIFDESPYKYYYVKVAAPPTFSFVPFEETIANGKLHIFKGTLDVSFISVDPFGYSDYALLAHVPVWNGNSETWTSNKPYSSTNLPGWYLESGLHASVPVPSLAYANVGSGYAYAGTLTAGSLTPNFYNGGEVASEIEFTFTIPVFSSPTVFQFKNLTQDPDEIFQLESLKYLSALSAQSTGTWTIHCNPSKGMITGTSSITGGTIYNLGALHNGIFVKAHPGNNTLFSSHNLTNPSIKYKYKYW